MTPQGLLFRHLSIRNGRSLRESLVNKVKAAPAVSRNPIQATLPNVRKAPGREGPLFDLISRARSSVQTTASNTALKKVSKRCTVNPSARVYYS